MKNRFFLGIDTSAYTTSIALINDNDEVLLDNREILNVKKGKKGLRQQEAIFQHMLNVPYMIENIFKKINFSYIMGVGISSKPRNVEGSYMPVFRVGEGYGKVISDTLNVPLFSFSHQDGHIAAINVDNNLSIQNDFLALHISGGTTELLEVKNSNKGYKINICGGTSDISAGQLIDRIGVKLGFGFPAGRELEYLFKDKGKVLKKVPISTKNSWINFSGPETYFIKTIDKGDFSKEDIVRSLFYCVGKSLANILEYKILEEKYKEILIIGGVASNNYIRQLLKEKLSNYADVKILFPKNEYCTDNAIGIAWLCRRSYISKEGENGL
ncbi:hypothetical protein [Clostridiisalibacter paucivorans]|uniref:hypothetical protein n=1 Tax=Clostridiisalibacter paucivorans TaxID=408753 RepID=UPI00047E096D|nr:hypothetical protein [Clostridiisalibacter paucivorans]